MSKLAMNWAWKQRNLTPSEKLVCLALSWRQTEKGLCCPSVPMLMEMCDLTERSVRSALKGLAKKGLILVIRRSANGKTLVNNYTLKTGGRGAKNECLEGCKKCTPNGGANSAPNKKVDIYIKEKGSVSAASNVVSFPKVGGGNV